MTETIHRGLNQPKYFDNLQVERLRGITLKAKTANMTYWQSNLSNQKADKQDSPTFMLNIIHTTGHIDFNYEASWLSAACQDALSVVGGDLTKKAIMGYAPMGKVYKVGELKLEGYFRYSDQAREEKLLYHFYPKSAEKVPELIMDYGILKYFNEDLFCVVGKKRLEWIIVGPSRSRSLLHTNSNSSFAWKWVLFPHDVKLSEKYCPIQNRAEVSRQVSISILKWCLNFYSNTKSWKKSSVECVCKAEMIFVLNELWHLVINLEHSVATTENFASMNLLDVLDLLKDQPIGSLGKSSVKFILAEEQTDVTFEFDDFTSQEYVKRKLLEIVLILKNDTIGCEQGGPDIDGCEDAKLVAEADSSEVLKTVIVCFPVMYSRFTAPSEKGDFQILDQLKDSYIWQLFMRLPDQNNISLRASSSRYDLMNVLGDTHCLNEFTSALSLKCSYLLVDKDHVKASLLKVGVQHSYGHNELPLSCMTILVMLDRFWPLRICAIEEYVVYLLNSDNEITKRGVLVVPHILAKAEDTIQEQLGATYSFSLTLELLRGLRPPPEPPPSYSKSWGQDFLKGKAM